MHGHLQGGVAGGGGGCCQHNGDDPRNQGKCGWVGCVVLASRLLVKTCPLHVTQPVQQLLQPAQLLCAAMRSMSCTHPVSSSVGPAHSPATRLRQRADLRQNTHLLGEARTVVLHRHLHPCAMDMFGYRCQGVARPQDTHTHTDSPLLAKQRRNALVSADVHSCQGGQEGCVAYRVLHCC